MAPKLEELRKVSEMVVLLLKSPEPGLSSWHIMLGDRAKDLKTILEDLFPSKLPVCPKCGGEAILGCWNECYRPTAPTNPMISRPSPDDLLETIFAHCDDSYWMNILGAAIGDAIAQEISFWEILKRGTAAYLKAKRMKSEGDLRAKKIAKE